MNKVISCIFFILLAHKLTAQTSSLYIDSLLIEENLNLKKRIILLEEQLKGNSVNHDSLEFSSPIKHKKEKEHSEIKETTPKISPKQYEKLKKKYDEQQTELNHLNEINAQLLSLTDSLKITLESYIQQNREYKENIELLEIYSNEYKEDYLKKSSELFQKTLSEITQEEIKEILEKGKILKKDSLITQIKVSLNQLSDYLELYHQCIFLLNNPFDKNHYENVITEIGNKNDSIEFPYITTLLDISEKLRTYPKGIYYMQRAVDNIQKICNRFGENPDNIQININIQPEVKNQLQSIKSLVSAIPYLDALHTDYLKRWGIEGEHTNELKSFPKVNDLEEEIKALSYN